MKAFLHDCAIILACLLAVEAAQAAPVTVRVPMPTAYSDGTALPVASRVAARVYCGPTTGRYVQGWATESTADVVEVTIDVRSRVFCAATVIARAAEGAGDVESDFSVEFVRTANQPAVPLNITTVTQAPAICTTTCTVDRRR